MFAELLTTREQHQLMKLVAYIAAIDGEVHEQEIEFIQTLNARLQLDPTNWFEEIEDLKLGEICAEFERDKAKRIVLTELINASFADGDYSESERAGLRAIAGSMAVDETGVVALEQWVERGVRWQREGRKLLGLEP
jgi:tellurite resistance protein